MQSLRLDGAPEPQAGGGSSDRALGLTEGTEWGRGETGRGWGPELQCAPPPKVIHWNPGP